MSICPTVAREMRSPFMLWWLALEEALVAAGGRGSTYGQVRPLFDAGVAPAEAAARLSAA